MFSEALSPGDSWLRGVKGEGLLWKERSKTGNMRALWLGLEGGRQGAW